MTSGYTCHDTFAEWNYSDLMQEILLISLVMKDHCTMNKRFHSSLFFKEASHMAPILVKERIAYKVDALQSFEQTILCTATSMDLII